MENKIRKLAALMAAMLLLAGCGGENAAESAAVTEAVSIAATESAAAETTEAEETVEESIANGMEFAPAETPGIAVQTPYITLYCPEEWQDTVKVDQKEENGTCTATFHTAVANTDAVLFSVVFSTGGTAEGFPLGSLAHETGTIYVFVAMNETVPEGLSDEEIVQFRHHATSPMVFIASKAASTQLL